MTIVPITVAVLGPVYGLLYWLASRLPIWALMLLLGITAAPYMLNWDYLMGGGIKFSTRPIAFLIAVVGALAAALAYRLLAQFWVQSDAERRVRLRILAGIVGFPVSATAVLKSL